MEEMEIEYPVVIEPSSITRLKLAKKIFISSRHADELKSWYIFERELGHGAQGQVLLITHRENGWKRAVKVVNKSTMTQASKHEIQILARLDHPNIVRIIDSYEDEQYCYLVMEYWSGGDLFSKIIREKWLTEAMVKKYMQQIVSALSYIHSSGIWHRDLKPENCLMTDDTPEAIVKIVDFGMAKETSLENLMHSVSGTPFYIAPEVLAREYTLAVDCWSVGVMMYLMLSGHPPFPGRRTEEVFFKIRIGHFDFKHPAFKLVSDSAKELIAQCIMKNPDYRLTAQQILAHHWMADTTDDPATNIDIYSMLRDNLCDFVGYSEIKKAALTFMACNITETDIKALRVAFKQLDSDQDGYITYVDLLSVMETQFGSQEIIQNIVNLIDTNQNGKIDYTEFLAAGIDRMIYLQNDNLRSMFQFFDQDGDGMITVSELRKIFQTLALTRNNTDIVMRALEQADADGNGFIDFNEFKNLMS